MNTDNPNVPAAQASRGAADTPAAVPPRAAAPAPLAVPGPAAAAVRAAFVRATDPAAELALLERLQAEASARAGAAAPSAPAPLAPAFRRLAGDRRDNAKIHVSDLRPLGHRPDTDRFLSRLRERVTQLRRAGDPSAVAIGATGAALVYFLRRGGRRGFAHVGLRSLATAARLSVETVRRCIVWCQDAGLVDVLNSMERMTVGGVRRLVRWWNVYLIRPADGAAPPDSGPRGPRAPVSVLSLALETATRWRAAFGLALRARGLNAAPARGSG